MPRQNLRRLDAVKFIAFQGLQGFFPIGGNLDGVLDGKRGNGSPASLSRQKTRSNKAASAKGLAPSWTATQEAVLGKVCKAQATESCRSLPPGTRDQDKVGKKPLHISEAEPELLSIPLGQRL